MIRQESTYYDNYNIKTLSEYSEGVLVSYEEFNKEGKLILGEDIDGNVFKFEYDKKNRLKRAYLFNKENGMVEWKTYSYTKVNMVILHRREGNPPVILKMWFGPKNENGERELIMEKFL